MTDAAIDLEDAAVEAACRLRVLLQIVDLSSQLNDRERRSLQGFDMVVIREQLAHCAERLSVAATAAETEREAAVSGHQPRLLTFRATQGPEA